jgi:hypothetical protein
MKTTVLWIFILILLLAVPAGAHVTDNLAVADLPAGYSSLYAGVGPQMSQGDIFFPESFPDPTTLTKQERFWIAGLQPGTAASSVGYYKWNDALIGVLQGYWTQHHAVPAALTPEIIEQSSGRPDKDGFLKSPVTNEYPKLDCKEYSRGNLYIQHLDAAQLKRLAAYDVGVRYTYIFRKVWSTEKQDWVSGTGSEAFYIRKYGEHDIIMTGILYMQSPLP